MTSIRDENGKVQKFIDYKWFIWFLMAIAGLMGALSTAYFYPKADATRLQERVDTNCRELEFLKKNYQTIDKKLNILLYKNGINPEGL